MEKAASKLDLEVNVNGSVLILSAVMSISGVWSSMNVDPCRWNEIASLLSENGFDTVFYPAAYGNDTYKDGLQACLEACHPQGIEVHALIVMFKSRSASDPLNGIEDFETRMQGHSDGSMDPEWLDPTDPRNVQLMTGICLEIASEFPVDGIHLDRIRWRDYLSGYSDSTRVRFMRDTGILDVQWPDDCLDGGEYHEDFLDWRASAVTSAVREVRNSLSRLNRTVQLSAAVMPKEREMIYWGQLWNEWLQDDLIDFAVPMNYTESDSQLSVWGEQQISLAGNETVYCGIGYRSSASELTENQMDQQIALAEQLGYDGLVVYRLCDDLIDLLRRRSLPEPDAIRVDP